MISGTFVNRSSAASNPRGFFLDKHKTWDTPLYWSRAPVIMAAFSSFLEQLKITGPGAAVHMANHTYIQELRFPDGGDIYFEGTNHKIVKLIVPGTNSQKLVIHVCPNIDWEKFVIETDIGADIIVKEDIVVE